MKPVYGRFLNTSVLFALLCCLLLTSCGPTPTAAPTSAPIILIPTYADPGGDDNAQSFVNISLNSAKFTGRVSDASDTGHLQMILVVSDDSGHADALICSYGNAKPIYSGDTVSPCKSGLFYPKDQLQGNLYVMLIAVDAKDTNDLADVGTNAITSSLGYGLQTAITALAPEAIAATGGWGIVGFLALDTLIGYSGSKVQQYFQRNYEIGSQSFALLRQYNWNNGRPVTASSANGQVEFTFTVQESSTAQGKIVPVAPAAPLVEADPPTAVVVPPAVDKITTARISCDDNLYYISLRRTPGYLHKSNTDSIVNVECGQTVELVGTKKKADGLTWWRVSWGGHTGWMADHTSSGKTVLLFDQ